MRFRPCIDLHDGLVKQIVGGTLSDATSAAPAQPVTNFVATQGAAHFAAMYASDGLAGGHVIMLGKGNEGPAMAALRAYPGGMQVGGACVVWVGRAEVSGGGSERDTITSCGGTRGRREAGMPQRWLLA
jgi:phosphoribosylformimino-5-aminoimidazole carboxamide ribotide isomerase